VRDCFRFIFYLLLSLVSFSSSSEAQSQSNMEASLDEAVEKLQGQDSSATDRALQELYAGGRSSLPMPASLLSSRKEYEGFCGFLRFESTATS